MKIPPGGIPTPEIPTHQTPHWKPPPPWKNATQKILTWNIPPISLIVFLHLTLRFDKCSQRKDFSTFKTYN